MSPANNEDQTGGRSHRYHPHDSLDEKATRASPEDSGLRKNEQGMGLGNEAIQKGHTRRREVAHRAN